MTPPDPHRAEQLDTLILVLACLVLVYMIVEIIQCYA